MGEGTSGKPARERAIDAAWDVGKNATSAGVIYLFAVAANVIKGDEWLTRAVGGGLCLVAAALIAALTVPPPPPPPYLFTARRQVIFALRGLAWMAPPLLLMVASTKIVDPLVPNKLLLNVALPAAFFLVSTASSIFRLQRRRARDRGAA